MNRSKFSLSHYKLFTGNMGELVPIGLTEVLPGDSIQQSSSLLLRCSPLLAPVMHPVHVTVHHWFVPHRLVWENWEDFITGGQDGLNASAFPVISSPGPWGEGSLADYLGVPADAPLATIHSALPFRAYNVIWNEWYRDADIFPARVVDLTDGTDTTTDTAIAYGMWEKDYFTTCRPWTQKGPEVSIPIGGQAPVKGIGKFTQNFGSTSGTVYESGETGSTVFPNYTVIDNTVNDTIWRMKGTAATSAFPDIYADLAGADGGTIQALREALAIQRYEEARARYGSRYTEYLRYLGVMSSDARLQRPEYLGGGRQTIQFSEVLQSGVTTSGATPGVGNISGHGIAAMRSNRYRRYFEEHGYIMSLMCVRPKTIYSDGLFRTWNRRTKEDFWQKELEGIGQQEVLNKEIYAKSATPDGVWGYQDRYDEYRRAESSIAGEFRSTLNFWHYARIFASQPVLGEDFMESTPTKRTNQVTNKHVLWVMANHSIQARRLVSKVGTPYTK